MTQLLILLTLLKLLILVWISLPQISFPKSPPFLLLGHLWLRFVPITIQPEVVPFLLLDDPLLLLLASPQTDASAYQIANNQSHQQYDDQFQEIPSAFRFRCHQ